MRHHPATTKHNYLAKAIDLCAFAAASTPGALRDIDVNHDDWCDALRGRGFCNCNPDVRLRPLPKHLS